VNTFCDSGKINPISCSVILFSSSYECSRQLVEMTFWNSQGSVETFLGAVDNFIITSDFGQISPGFCIPTIIKITSFLSELLKK